MEANSKRVFFKRSFNNGENYRKLRCRGSPRVVDPPPVTCFFLKNLGSSQKTCDTYTYVRLYAREEKNSAPLSGHKIIILILSTRQYARFEFPRSRW